MKVMDMDLAKRVLNGGSRLVGFLEKKKVDLCASQCLGM